MIQLKTLGVAATVLFAATFTACSSTEQVSPSNSAPVTNVKPADAVNKAGEAAKQAGDAAKEKANTMKDKAGEAMIDTPTLEKTWDSWLTETT